MKTDRGTRQIKVGEVAVDSGQIMVVDPCYLREWKANEYTGGGDDKTRTHEFGYDGACRESLFGAADAGWLNFAGGFQGAAVVASSGGDGCFPVYATVNEMGKIESITIEFA